MPGLRRNIIALASIGVVAALLGACTDTVYKDRPAYNPPPDSTSGFLGYYNASERQTTCGNCHVGQQLDWVQTLHASAWDTLQANPAAQQFCTECHTVNSRGNQPLAPVGYDKVQDPAYYDVQCESCHGPGFNHVQNPTVVANRPLPSILTYPNSSTPGADTAAVVNSSCGGCHEGAGPTQSHNYLKEWLSSRHGQLRANQAAEADCQPCHEGKGALAAWGVNTDYKELGTSTLLPQNCVVCHDPHGSAKDATGQPLEGQLRFPIDAPTPELNLCTHCHNRRSDPPASGSAPHGAQGGVLFGTAGYFPPGTVYDTTAILSTHGSTANPRLCAGCHVNAQAGVEGGKTIAFTGHTFHPIPCVMQKNPTLVDTTYTNDCAYDEASRSWAACTASGCHGTEAVAASRLNLIRDEVRNYVRVLWIDANHNRAVDAFPTDSGYLAKVQLNAPTELLNSTNVLTSAKGARFNAQLTADSLASHPDGSHGVHNPFLYRALLQSSIADMLATYPAFLPAPPAPVMSQIQAAIQSGQLKVAPRTERAVLAPSTTASR
jgi:cytochrome c554/c'-like protein